MYGLATRGLSSANAPPQAPVCPRPLTDPPCAPRPPPQAPPEVLERIAGLLEGPQGSVTLIERGDTRMVRPFRFFRVLVFRVEAQFERGDSRMGCFKVVTHPPTHALS